MQDDIAVGEIVYQHGLCPDGMATAFYKDEDEPDLPILKVAVENNFVLQVRWQSFRLIVGSLL